ncbi:alpha/beta fold hydrolase [Streptacidiphilus melanogenes]|uniref:alpha/beta fold hydrolase n=1 Tax=Streptacidiphilus melanogenes TaxID=411235 RepID=UPI0005A8473E|nr:alpha/beta fold hydrolase [Streptacidiphilus melanogenes]
MPRRWAAAVVAALIVVGGGTAVAAGDGGAPAVREQDRVFSMPETPGSGSTVRIDTAYFTTGDATPRPAVLLAHGFGGSKDDMAGEARYLAQHGYRVMTWSARGFGKSTGAIGLDAPDREVADVQRLVDWLGHRPDVLQDGPDDPRVGIAGGSYGGAIALLTAGHDKRVDAIAPQITWWDLGQALFPNGVFKKLWSGVFFTSGGGSDCRFTAQLCQFYQRAALSGTADPAGLALLKQSSPDSVAGSIRVPTLITQGQNDSLFPLSQGDAMARAIAANGAPVAVDWFSGGHDGGDQESARTQARTLAWFDRYLKHDKAVDTGPAFRVTRTGGVSVSAGQVVQFGASANSYPTLAGTSRRSVILDGRPQAVANPAGGMPPAVSSVPGLGGALSQLSGLVGGSLPISSDLPGQYAAFESAPLDSALQLTGAPSVKVTVDTGGTAPAVLFAKLYDVSPDGSSVLPHQLVTPLRVTSSGTVDVQLPAVDHDFAAGHRLRLVLASTDLGYSSPAAPATYQVSLPAADPLTLPMDTALRNDRTPLPAWVWLLPLSAAAVAAALVLTGVGARRRRRAGQATDPELAASPLVVAGLSKRYHGSADRYAVKDLSFRVERGQVLGLLGPNGAGKTTTMRMLMGLIRPDAGSVHLFGQSVAAGAPVLSRVGAFVEGAGFLPHLSGRANLDLYWQATGRPAEDAHVARALEIADLGEALERPVRTYSQGMRQRLAIAQAMLGLPDLLILDEPTNGLDPQQIREMRAVITRYASGGRTVIVSSHLLSEVEQTCTHLVVMTQGRLLAAGPVAEITGNDDELLVGTGEMSAGARDGVIAKLTSLDGVASVTAATDEPGLLVRLDGLAVPELLAELLRLDVPVERVGPHRRLEDAFLTLTGERA